MIGISHQGEGQDCKHALTVLAGPWKNKQELPS